MTPSPRIFAEAMGRSGVVCGLCGKQTSGAPRRLDGVSRPHSLVDFHAGARHLEGRVVVDELRHALLGAGALGRHLAQQDEVRGAGARDAGRRRLVDVAVLVLGDRVADRAAARGAAGVRDGRAGEADLVALRVLAPVRAVELLLELELVAARRRGRREAAHVLRDRRPGGDALLREHAQPGAGRRVDPHQGLLERLVRLDVGAPVRVAVVEVGPRRRRRVDGAALRRRRRGGSQKSERRTRRQRSCSEQPAAYHRLLRAYRFKTWSAGSEAARRSGLMLLVNAQNCLEVSNEDYSQSRCPILVCPITLARKKSQSLFILYAAAAGVIDALSALLSSRAESG